MSHWDWQTALIFVCGLGVLGTIIALAIYELKKSDEDYIRPGDLDSAERTHMFVVGKDVKKW